jgi:hypothetical protein
MSEENKVKSTAEVIQGIVEAVPVYRDAIQPAAKELGKGLETVARAVNVALAPIAALVWGYDKIREFVLVRVAEKLRSVPEDRICTPDPNVAGPVLQALRFTGHQESLREMYANLLATSLDAETCANAHPAFVDMIRTMSPDEAKIMRLFATREAFPVVDVHAKNKKTRAFDIRVRNFSLIGQEAGCEHPQMIPSYLDNLSRLGLLELPGMAGFGKPILTQTQAYEALENAQDLAEIRTAIEQDEGLTLEFSRGSVVITAFGRQFCQACVVDKNIIDANATAQQPTP